MFTAPLGAFFLFSNFIFHNKEHPDAWAGGAAILIANIVIAGYVVSAFSEEDEEYDALKKIAKGGPRVGAFKIRTD